MTDVFNASTTPADPLAELVGDGKKFKTPEDLARGKIESDAFIEQLKDELKGLKEDLKNRSASEDQLDLLRKEIIALKTNTQQPAPPAQREANQPPALTEDTIKQLVAKTITQAETQRTASANILEANQKVIDKFGSMEKAQEVVQARASELGISMDYLKNLAAQSPTAFLKLVADQPVAPSGGNLPTNGSVNPSAFQANAGGMVREGTKAWYDKMRTDNPKQYWTTTVQQRIFEAKKSGTYDA